MTQDVCKVLKILPDTFRQRIYRGYYPEFDKIGVKRIFTLEQIKALIRVTEGLTRNGVCFSLVHLINPVPHKIRYVLK